ncbi:MAG TPA: mercury methylation ferredoxin HgcB [Bacteroidales bacterium]|nr:mercury methylation ferredoxin HgcB [Bacteroidales bacterium]
MKDFVYLKNVVTLELDQAKCNACGMCVKVCPRAVFTISGGKAHIANRDYCMECGACALNCEKRAITVLSGLGCGCATGIIEGYFNGVGSECECSCDN